jgi:glyoxylase-like metal-dependent hydrolase (beta-lactamase superfamily II)
MSVHSAPGHTPGHLFYLVSGGSRDVIFTGDAAKNRAELLSRTADMTYDQPVSRKSISAIWEVWRRRPGTVLIPGHDLPMIIENGEPRYLACRGAGIAAWFGTALDQLTIFDIAVS